jgi:hypothetical protein
LRVCIESQWALVTMSAERTGGERTAKELVELIAVLEHNAVLGQDGVLLVLPAETKAVCRHMLDSGAVSLGKLQQGMAVCLWLTMLLGVGPLYAMLTHDWTWEVSFYYTFITMTTIGFGDYYPNSDGARYTDCATQRLSGGHKGCDARHHQVFVWCMGIIVIVLSLSVRTTPLFWSHSY